MTPTERMRVSRSRRRAGLRSVSLEVRDTEVQTLISWGLLAPSGRDDRAAIGKAIGKLFDVLPLHLWPSVLRR